MKRKLFLGLAALAALTITSCQKDLVINQIPEEQPIGFGTYVGRDAQTKASVTNLDAMQDNNYAGFGVFAYYTGSTAYTDEQTSFAPNFMYNEKVKYNKSNSKWEYSPYKYWPNNDDKISFFAYAPFGNSNITNFSENTAKSDPTVTFTVNNDVSLQVDLLYASALNQNKTANSEDGVNLTFNHALSRIGFKVKPATKEDKVAVNKITLSGAFTKSGDCNLYTGDITGTPSTDTYELDYTGTNKIEATGENATVITSDDGYLMIIPTNKFNSENMTISVDYDLYTYDDKLSGDFAAVVNKKETGTITGITFEKGKAYTFVLTISPNDPIIFKVEEPIAWDEDLDKDTITNGDDDKPVTVG